MPILGVDLGATKLAVDVFAETGVLLSKASYALEKRKGKEVGELVTSEIKKCLTEQQGIWSIGISVPGISRHKTGTVWAPNIEDWEDYPLREEVKRVAGVVPVTIESDRTCSILGEQWQGNARGCRDAIFIAVGTGIGAGILVDGKILRGAHDIGGAIGWMALPKPFTNHQLPEGSFEFYASGAGMVKCALHLLRVDQTPSSLRILPAEEMTARNVFEACDRKDPIATRVIEACIAYWGMAAANLVSIFNPEKIIFGGGIFGPAAKFLPEIKTEATKWAQPISITQVTFERSILGGDAAAYGAGFLALKNINPA
jgi:glucokinase